MIIVMTKKKKENKIDTKRGREKRHREREQVKYKHIC